MNAQNNLSKIAELLSVELAKRSKKQTLASMKLDNGTVIEAENFAAGEAVFIATEDENVALPVGEYALEDGRILIVTEEGIIAEIREAAAEEAPAEEEAAPAEESTEMAEEEVVVEAPEEVAPEMQEIVETVVSVIAPVIEEVKEQVEEMKRKFEEIVDEKKAEEEKKEELSRKAPARKPIKANPEAQPQKEMVRFAQSGRKSTLDRVLGKISNR